MDVGLLLRYYRKQSAQQAHPTQPHTFACIYSTRRLDSSNKTFLHLSHCKPLTYLRLSERYIYIYIFQICIRDSYIKDKLKLLLCSRPFDTAEDSLAS